MALNHALRDAQEPCALKKVGTVLNLHYSKTCQAYRISRTGLDWTGLVERELVKRGLVKIFSRSSDIMTVA